MQSYIRFINKFINICEEFLKMITFLTLFFIIYRLTSPLILSTNNQTMKLSYTTRNTISAILILLVMAGVFGAVIALSNQYLRNHDLLTPLNKSILITVLVIGYYLIYRWFTNRLNKIHTNMNL